MNTGNKGRRFLALVSAFALLGGLAVAAGTPERHDRVNAICAIFEKFAHCVPQDG
jgi:hypothetical protein